MAEDEKSKHDKIVKFINQTEQFAYSCVEGCCLIMFVNGMRFCWHNCTCDEEGTVYIIHKDCFEAPCPFLCEFIASFGQWRKNTDPPIEIKFSDCDLSLDGDHIIRTIKANHISISRIAGTHDFVIRCLDS